MDRKQIKIKNRLTGKEERFGDILPEKMDDHTAICILRDKREALYYAEDIINMV